MPTLRAPSGRTYRTDDDTEVRNLTLGYGYTVVPDKPAAPEETEPAERRPGRRKATKTDDTPADETTE
ncbi:hypothetical protein [Saccharopolyspora spinosa]|uniref:Uncharacterized protein n=1 Tax=Saccharopolyspora spinosa TaxID=60894 RepID=A0A2N3XZ21_SACSN|nr:hypothetical protein [Saccharopolyspora spinosa]PKW15924.1 hypothetical protein A8926_3706 [Saccharopolyspora spinosa]